MATELIKDRAHFITFEGVEGCGKSTQLKRLAQKLRDVGVDVVETREPGGSQKAENIRKFLLSGQAEHLGPKAEAMLFAAARMDHLEQVIRPALQAGKWVLCDRFMDSTRVYQGQYLEADLLDYLEKSVVKETRPDLTVLLDVPAEEGIVRVMRRGGNIQKDRFERESLDIHERRRLDFLKLSETEPDRFLVFDSTSYPKTVERQIWRAFQEKFRFDAAL